MRSWRWLLSLVVLAACSSDGPTSAPAQHDPLPGPASALAVVAGDAQEGEPGKPLSTAPVIVVQDASGRTVSGITVAFAVETGGGSLERSSAVTGTDGKASPGAWSLGATEGANSMRATVGTLTPISIRATARYPVTHIAQTSIGVTGGTIAYNKPGDPMDGLRLDIPSGSFATASVWTVDVRPAATVAPLRGHAVRTPVISIATDQGMAAHPLTLRIPVTLSPDSMLLVYLNDPATGYLEPLPVAGRDAQSVTVLARHLSAAQLPRALPSLHSAIPAFTRAEPGTLRLITIAEATEKLASGPITSEFQPGVDDWEFSNNGSYLTPAGHVTGQSISALRYFNTVRSPADLTTNLSGRFDLGPFWADDRLGVRAAALAELAVHWAGVDEFLASVDQLAVTTGMNVDQAHLITIAEAIYVTRQPQLVMLRSGSTSIALVAFQVDLNGVLAADPANPGRALRIPFANGRFQPVSVVLDAGTGAITFGTVRAMGLSAVANVPEIDSQLAELLGGNVGVNEFPGYGMQYFDQNEGVWKEFTGTDLNVSWQNISLRATCATCARKLPNANPSTLTALDVYDGQARQLGTDRTAGRVDFTILPGSNRVGLHILGGAVASGGATTWRHVDFKYIRINSSRIFISPDPVNALINQSITLTANNQGLPTASYRFLWSFDDDTPGVAIDGVNTVSHTYARAGTFTARVIVKDPITNVEIGRATSQVLVDQPVPVWRITQWTQISASGPPADQSHDRAILQADAQLFDVLLGNPNKGVLFYLDAPLTVGNTTYNTGVHLQVSSALPAPTGLDPAIPSRSIARPQSAALFPNTLDKLTVTGELGAGDLSGQSVDAFWNTVTCTTPGVLVPWLDWSITGVKSGTTLSGRIRRTQRMTIFGGGTGASCLVEFKGFSGDFVQEWSFTATRLK